MESGLRDGVGVANDPVVGWAALEALARVGAGASRVDEYERRIFFEGGSAAPAIELEHME